MICRIIGYNRIKKPELCNQIYVVRKNGMVNSDLPQITELSKYHSFYIFAQSEFGNLLYHFLLKQISHNSC